MIKKFKLSLFIFRRDLRLEDNTALIAALHESEMVIPCFIFDDRQIKNNAYFSKAAFQFMLESLVDLKNELEKHQGHLYFFHGAAEKIIYELLNVLPIEAIYFNRDYTPFSLARDQKIAALSKNCFIYADALLNEPEIILKSDQTPYTIFSPFMRKSREHVISKPKKCSYHHFYTVKITLEKPAFFTELKDNIKNNNAIKGGRSEAKKQYRRLENLNHYARDRDFPALSATSHLSAHHKFGTVSIRETYHQIIDYLGESTLISELYWRDFFTHIGFHFPNVFKESFRAKYNKINWSNNTSDFKKWCDGQTGFPIVDAGMRELNNTGYMHNRVRMITASFLVKDLQIDWRWGERYFAQHLLDYDPAVNNGNWQWAASTGCDAQPYFRIFNPHLQQKRFDPDAVYIKKWVPEWQTSRYPQPIVDHAIVSQQTKALFTNVK